MSKKIIDHQNVFDYHKKNKKQDYANNNRVSFVSEKSSYNMTNKKIVKEKNTEIENNTAENNPYKKSGCIQTTQK